MMRWKDLPIRKRLLAANYLMMQRLILYLAGKRPHPVHPVRTDPAPGPVGPL